MSYKSNVLIVGSGISGLTLGIKLAIKNPSIQIDIITKNKFDESNTKLAQGGIAVVTTNKRDSYNQHINDTLTAGHNINNKKIVSLIVKQAPQQLKELENWGVSFDLLENNKYSLGLEGGHLYNRIVHHKDHTGKHLEEKLLQKVNLLNNIQLHSYLFAIDIVKDNGICTGLKAMDLRNNKSLIINSNFVVMATGGIGQVFKSTTNPAVATGDGIAMAARAGANILDMEFLQFHPTALYCNKNPLPLISEAVRGFGGFLKNHDGIRFMNNYHRKGELAPRDIVSKGIFMEMKKSNKPFVYLDCTHFEKGSFQKKFPQIFKCCLELNIHPENDLLPVCPSMHYLCGGIEINKNGETTIPNLFALGECARSGMHGSNRLASNSLLEAIVISDFCARKILRSISWSKSTSDRIPIKNINPSIKTQSLEVFSLKGHLQKLMTENLGIIKSNKSIAKAEKGIIQIRKEIKELEFSLKKDFEFLEFKNMVDIAELIINQARNRGVNIGTFFNKDLY